MSLRATRGTCRALPTDSNFTFEWTIHQSRQSVSHPLPTLSYPTLSKACISPTFAADAQLPAQPSLQETWRHDDLPESELGRMRGLHSRSCNVLGCISTSAVMRGRTVVETSRARFAPPCALRWPRRKAALHAYNINPPSSSKMNASYFVGSVTSFEAQQTARSCACVRLVHLSRWHPREIL